VRHCKLWTRWLTENSKASWWRCVLSSSKLSKPSKDSKLTFWELNYSSGVKRLLIEKRGSETYWALVASEVPGLNPYTPDPRQFRIAMVINIGGPPMESPMPVSNGRDLGCWLRLKDEYNFVFPNEWWETTPIKVKVVITSICHNIVMAYRVRPVEGLAV